MRRIYAVPEYVLSKYIPEHIAQHCPQMEPIDAYKYDLNHPTVSELAEALGIKKFDTALPIDWVREIQHKTDFNPYGHFVWSYDDVNIFGEPRPITREGVVALEISNSIIDLSKE